MGLGISKWDVVLVNFDPTIGKEIKKTRPALVVSPNEINEYWSPIVVIPMTSKIKDLGFRTLITFQGIQGQVAIDQIRAVDRVRIWKQVGNLKEEFRQKVQTDIDLFFAE